jgi:hypothetical protein
MFSYFSTFVFLNYNQSVFDESKKLVQVNFISFCKNQPIFIDTVIYTFHHTHEPRKSEALKIELPCNLGKMKKLRFKCT